MEITPHMVKGCSYSRSECKVRIQFEKYYEAKQLQYIEYWRFLEYKRNIDTLSAEDIKEYELLKIKYEK